jgi:hypothetical protein
MAQMGTGRVERGCLPEAELPGNTALPLVEPDVQISRIQLSCRSTRRISD